MHEVQRPAGIGLRLDQDRRTRADRTPPGFALANGKTFLAIEPVNAIDAGRLSVPPSRTNSRRYPKGRRSLARSRSFARNSTSGGRQDRYRTIFRSADIIWQARRSERPMTVFRCATASRLAAGPTIFLQEAREVRLHPASVRPAASSVSRSRLQAPSAALPRRLPCRHIWLSNFKTLLLKFRACGRGRPPSRQPPAPSAPQ